MLEAAALLKKDHPKLQIILLQAKNLEKTIFEDHLKKHPKTSSSPATTITPLTP